MIVVARRATYAASVSIELSFHERRGRHCPRKTRRRPRDVKWLLKENPEY